MFQSFRTVAVKIVFTLKLGKVTYKGTKTSFILDGVGLTKVFSKSHHQI